MSPIRTMLAVIACITALVTVTASPAGAVETYRSGSAVGVHADAAVACSSYPYNQIVATPEMGTSRGWEWGQNVAWRFYLLTDTGRVVWRPTNDAWSQARIATAYYQTINGLGTQALVTNTYATLPDMSWRVTTGRYVVRLDYAWQTTAGWNYATNVTSYYANATASNGFKQTWTMNACNINVL